jgi:hypothetical protein
MRDDVLLIYIRQQLDKQREFSPSEVRRLVSMIDWLEGILCDMQGEDGPRLQREQGAAEGRKQVIDAVSVLYDVTDITAELPPLPELLPSQAAAAALEESRYKTAAAESKWADAEAHYRICHEALTHILRPEITMGSLKTAEDVARGAIQNVLRKPIRHGV